MRKDESNFFYVDSESFTWDECDPEPWDLGVWKTESGREIRYIDMTVAHLRNCIRKIERSETNWRGAHLPGLYKALERKVLLGEN